MPVLTPIGLDPAHPFPRVFNKSLNFAVELEGSDAFGRNSRRRHRAGAARAAARDPPAARRSPAREHDFVFLSSILHAHVGELFAGMNVLGCYQFRVTRNSRPVRRRGGGQEPAHRAAGRAAAAPLRRRGAPGGRRQLLRSAMAEFLLQQFGLEADDLYRVDGPGQPGTAAAGARPGRPPRPQVPAVPARAAAGARRSARPLRGAAQAATCCCTTRSSRSRR